jgi:predicted phage terminase large subunit-like protein
MRPVHRRSPDDQVLYDACEWDLLRFATEFFPHWCTDPFNQVHLDYYALWRTRQGSRGHRDVVAAPRGASKTTGCALLGILHACVYGYESFIVYLTNTYDNAESEVKQLRDELETNAKLIRVYDAQVGSVWNQGDFTTTGGTRVLAAARNSQVRGITQNGQRPTKIVCDDVEHPDQVLTELQRQKTLRWFTNDILKLGQPRTNIELSGTILHADSFLATMLHNPGWTPRHYQAVLRFADASAIPWWQQWRAIYLDLTNPTHQEDARTFFEAHRDEMLRGSAVLWEARRNYYTLMVSRLTDGEASFWQEDMNAPHADARHIFDMDHALWCRLHPESLTTSTGCRVHFLDITAVAAYWDPTPDRQSQTGDYTCCAVAMKDKYGYVYVVDAYCAQEPSTDTAMDAIVEMLWRWQVETMGIEANGFASLLPTELRRKIVAKAHQKHTRWDVTLLPVQNVRNKILRIRTLDPLIANGWLGFAESLPATYVQQFVDFIPQEGANRFDDGPDATEGCIRVLNRLFDRRSAF